MSFVFVRQPAESRKLVLLSTAAKALGVTSTEGTKMAQLERLIESATATIHSITDRVFARELVTERLGLDDIDIGGLTSRGAGRPTHRIMLRRRPVLMIEAIRFNGSAIDLTDVQLENSDAGFVFSPSGFSGTTLYHQQIESVRTRFNEPLWEVDYSAGYVLPGFPNVKLTVLAAAINTSTDRITSAAHRLRNGDTVHICPATDSDVLPEPLLDGFDYYVRDASAGDFRLADQPNGSAIDLTTAGTGSFEIERRTTLPPDLESAALDLVIDMQMREGADRTVLAERLGDYQVQRSVTLMAEAVPPSIMQRIERYVDLV